MREREKREERERRESEREIGRQREEGRDFYRGEREEAVDGLGGGRSVEKKE